MYIWFQENEKLKAEGVEKSKKIEMLNDKISDLLQKSQRYLSNRPQISMIYRLMLVEHKKIS